jgi:membrane-bound inhibitor of C-type lysozyme
MNRRKIDVIFGAGLCLAGIATGASPGVAQTFQSYRCADHTQFIVGFFDHDSRAHLQVDGHEVTLAKRFALSGARYSGGGVTLKIGKEGITLKHIKRPVTKCEAI